MLTFTAGCICNSEALRSANQDNLLFSGQILPEVNGGLSGVPTAKFTQDTPFLTAVFDGQGSAGAKAACFAAGAFRAAADKLRSEADLSALLQQLQSEFSAKAPADTSVSALAALVTGDRLYMTDSGSCRAYLLRDRALYLLSEKDASGARPHTASGALRSGDRLLLCSDGLFQALDDAAILRILAGESTAAGALRSLLEAVKQQRASDSVTAIALLFD